MKDERNLNGWHILSLFFRNFAFMNRINRLLACALAVGLLVFFSACSTTKFVPEGEHMLVGAKVKSHDKALDVSLLEPYVRQTGNSRWFSLFKVPLGVYSLAGRDTTKWLNRTFQNIGEAPVVFDTLQALYSCKDLAAAMRDMGYLNAHVDLETKSRGKRLKAVYHLHPGEPYYLGDIHYDIHDEEIAAKLANNNELAKGLHTGDRFSINKLDEERKRLTSFLMDNGYYRFNKDFIHYTADSTSNDRKVDVTLHLEKYRANSKSPETDHPCYIIRNVTFSPAANERIHLRQKVLELNSAIKEHEPFSSADLQKTYNNFGRLQAVKFTNIRFAEVPDSQLLDCDIQLSMNKPSTLAFQPEGTNTAGDLGAAASLTYENRNLFRGSEVLSVQLRAAFEAITGLEGYQNQDYEEYGVETKLAFPRFVAPMLSKSFRRRSSATSELSLSYNLQNRPEFHRRVFSTAWRYRWTEPTKNRSFRIDLPDLNYVYMPWISATFKEDYLDNANNRNAILRYNYSDLFIMKIGFGISYNNGNHAIRTNFETAGNLLTGGSKLLGFNKNENNQYTLFNIAFAQYAKFDFDYTRLIKFDAHNQLALHADFGIAYPYGNSTVLPFEKRYFSGGANSVRGWSVRGLGPGKYRGTDGRIDFINQTGDMKLDLNLEYRTYLFWKFNGALFIDAGNIWTLRSYAEQQGGQFKLDEFYKQIAVAYGLGMRLNFDYFILRFDLGMKAVDPAYDTHREHFPFLRPKFSRDYSFHFAVGLPF